jgi:hypothetical protein
MRLDDGVVDDWSRLTGKTPKECELGSGVCREVLEFGNMVSSLNDRLKLHVSDNFPQTALR